MCHLPSLVTPTPGPAPFDLARLVLIGWIVYGRQGCCRAGTNPLNGLCTLLAACCLMRQ